MSLSVTSSPSGLRTGHATAGGGALFVAAAALLGLSLAASVVGLLVDDVYAGAESTAAMFRGYDLVTALVVAPVLGVATLALHRPSRTPTLVPFGA